MTRTRATRAGPLEEKPLAPMQARFAEEYLVDLNATQAAIRAGYSRRSAEQQGMRLLKNARVAAVIEAAKEARAKRIGRTADEVVRELWELALADPTELVEVQRVCCRKCYGDATPYDPRKPARLECTECFGEGVERVYVKDTRSLSPAAKLLFAGAKHTRDGIDVRMHDRFAALSKLLDHLGRPAPKENPADDMDAEERARAIREQLDAMDRVTIGVSVSVDVAA